MLWDTAGQEEFDAITKAYYRGELLCLPSTCRTVFFKNNIVNFIIYHFLTIINCHIWFYCKQLQLCCCIVVGAQVCVLTFSTIDRESFEAIERWKEKVG